MIISYTYFPYLVSFFPTETPIFPANSSTIQIPKLNVTAQIIENVDPWNEKEYEKALKKGVAKAKGFENFYFAHSSLPPWEMTRVNTAFLKLGQLNMNDEIIITQNGQKTTYKVTSKQEVWPWQTEALKNHENNLILQTCTPPGTDFKRLLVFASKISN